MDIKFDKRNYLTACKRLEAQVDVRRLQAEVAALPENAWSNERARVHQHTRSVFLKGYPPRLGINHDPEHPILAACPYIRELLYGVISGKPGKCLLAALFPGSLVYPHRDVADAYFVRSFRLHVPVFTNDKVRLYCDGNFFRMREGEIWTINNLAPHAVINDHPVSERVHLIFDVFPDETGIERIQSLPETEGDADPALFRRLDAAANELVHIAGDGSDSRQNSE